MVAVPLTIALSDAGVVKQLLPSHQLLGHFIGLRISIQVGRAPPTAETLVRAKPQGGAGVFNFIGDLGGPVNVNRRLALA